MRSHPFRLSAQSYVGRQRVFLTLCTRNRATFFTDRAVVQEVLTQFLQSCVLEQFEVSAYCFMPDHLHTLVGGLSPVSDLLAFVRLAKQSTGFHFKRRHGVHLWQESFFDRTLRPDEDAQDIVRYIVNNPVRAGLVSSPQDYEFWGSQTHTRAEILESSFARESKAPGL